MELFVTQTHKHTHVHTYPRTHTLTYAHIHTLPFHTHTRTFGSTNQIRSNPSSRPEITEKDSKGRMESIWILALYGFTSFHSALLIGLGDAG